MKIVEQSLQPDGAPIGPMRADWPKTQIKPFLGLAG